MISSVTAGLPVTDLPIGLVGTQGTVTSGAFPRALAGHVVHQVATEDLLRMAEEGGGDSHAIRVLATEAFDQLRALGCHHVVLACTDFTCVLADLEAVADGLELIDPLEQAAQLAAAQVGNGARRSSARSSDPIPGGSDEVYLTGPHPVDVARYAHDRFGLCWPEPTFVHLPAPSPAR